MMELYKLLDSLTGFFLCVWLLVSAVPTPDPTLCSRHCDVHASLLHSMLLLKILNEIDSFRN